MSTTPSTLERLTVLAAKYQLTAKQLQTLALMADGLSYKEIMDVLGVGETTVWFHLNAVRQKTGTKSTAHALAKICLNH